MDAKVNGTTDVPVTVRLRPPRRNQGGPLCDRRERRQAGYGSARSRSRLIAATPLYIPAPPENSISASNGKRMFSSAYAFMSYSSIGRSACDAVARCPAAIRTHRGLV